MCGSVEEQHGHQDLVLKLSWELSNFVECVEWQHSGQESKELSFG